MDAPFLQGHDSMKCRGQVCGRTFGLIVQLEAAGPDGICVVDSSIAYTHFDSAASGRVLPTMVLTCQLERRIRQPALDTALGGVTL
jgi:hypothetical protein